MLPNQVESSYVSHYDAIHHTNLLHGVKVNVGKLTESGWKTIDIDKENETYYHIRTICQKIAEEFFKNKKAKDFIPCDFQSRPILGIQLDGDFKKNALIEFASRQAAEEEEEPPLSPSSDALVKTLTAKLIEAFEKSGMNDECCKLSLARMQEIRDEVFDKKERAKKMKPISFRRDYNVAPLASNRASDNPEGCCSPTVVATAGLLSGLFVVVSLFDKMFSNKNERGQRVTRVNNFGLNTQVNSRGTIY